MTRSQLQASLKLWQSRKAYRYGKWRYYIRKERRAKTSTGKAAAHRLRAKWSKLHEEAAKTVTRRKRQLAENNKYGGSRAVTNEIIRIVGGRASVTSRKRPAWHPLSISNPSSDHSGLNRLADAVDFGTANNYSLAREIARRLGGWWSGDYDAFVISRSGNKYRVQIIAGTHGTGPHLHVGVRRI
jgi:hypothetical protein